MKMARKGAKKTSKVTSGAPKTDDGLPVRYLLLFWSAMKQITIIEEARVTPLPRQGKNENAPIEVQDKVMCEYPGPRKKSWEAVVVHCSCKYLFHKYQSHIQFFQPAHSPQPLHSLGT